MGRIEKEIVRLWHDCAGNLQQNRSIFSEPCGAQIAGRFLICTPILWEIVRLDDGNLYIRPFDSEQSKRWRHIIRTGMDTDFQQRRGRCRGQIHNRLARVVPAARRFQAARSAQVAVTADSPQEHLDEHAFVDLNQQFVDDPAARVRIQ